MSILADNLSSKNEELKADVLHYHTALYQFAFALTGSEADASDLTQQTFYIWATKGSQLRDVSKAKSWLFTTLHRAFLQTRRRQSRHPHWELSQVEAELPRILPPDVYDIDSAELLHAMTCLHPAYRAAVTLFYLEDYSYKEIAAILGVPIGTVKSRISRGLAQLYKLLTETRELPAEPLECEQAYALELCGNLSCP